MDNQFKDRLEQIKMRNLKVKHKKNASWPIEKKIEVVSQWLVLGNMKLVAASTGVGYDLIRAWKTQAWWKDLENEIRQTQNIEMDTKLSKIVERSLEAVLDRVENGDYFFDQKAQEVRRKPVTLRDVARVSVDILSKRELLRGNATERKETSQVSVQEHLKMMMAEFARWQTPEKQTIDVDVTDVTPHEPSRLEGDEVEMVEVLETDDALHDQRQEGLLEGESALQQPSGRSEETRGAEPSPSDDGESGPSS